MASSKEKPREDRRGFQKMQASVDYSAAISSFFSRAALNRVKSSPAWCEERVSGLDATIRKPLV
jgi:hypothetical protein